MHATHDLFLSYRWVDTPSVEPLVVALDARGVRVWRDAREVEDLSGIQKAVATGLSGSRALLAWYSGRYNESRACQWELTSAYIAAQAEGDPRLRILVVNPETGNAHVHLPELFDQLHLSGAGLSDPGAVHILADRIKEALSRVPTTALGALRSLTPPLWLPTMGTGSNRFVGRLGEMWRLHSALQSGHAAMLTGTAGKPGLALVRGAGGIGKSLMAEEYALRFGAAYPGGVFWLRAYGHPENAVEVGASQRINLRDAQVLDIAAFVGIDTSNLAPNQIEGALTRHLARQAQPFLWVVDDLPPEPGPDGLRGWQAPHPLGSTLFTTRTRRFTHVLTIELPQLDRDDAIRLLTRQRVLSSADRITSDAICTLLGDHALAVDVTAALVDRRGLAAVREALRHPGRDALALAALLDEALPNGHQRHIAATFLASIEQLDDPARELLRYAAVLAVAPIPTQLLVNGIVAASKTAGAEEVDPADARDQVDRAISQLLSNSLVEDSGADAISVHVLVSRTIRFAEPSRAPWDTLRGRMVDVLGSELINARDIRRHAHLTPWVTHARYLTESPTDLATTNLLGTVARFDLELASYSLAREDLERELKVRTRIQGEEHPATLVTLNNLASALSNQGDLPSARRLQEAVLEARKRVLGEEHPATWLSMGNLAVTLSEQGDLGGARRLQEAVLDAIKRGLGEEHPEVSIAMSNLAVTLSRQGDLPGARWLQEAALEASKRVLGEGHPTTLTAMSNLAGALFDQGDLPGARRLLEAVLEASKRVLGEEHPRTLASMSNLATMFWLQGQRTAARQLQKAATVGYLHTFGAAHPDTAGAQEALERMQASPSPSNTDRR